MPKILLVEDDNSLREIFELRLQAEGYQTLTAGDGEEALVKAMKEKPDLIICDVMMPRMSGFEMLETLRNSPDMAGTMVIMMTALGQAEDQARGAKLGVVKYLVKSQVTLEDFARVVSDVVKLGPGANAPAGQTPAATNEVSQANNKLESENPMDDPSTNPMPGAPTPPAGPAGDANPITSPDPSPMGDGQQSTADEQSSVASQVNSFASTPATPSDSAAPTVGGGMTSTDPVAAEPAEHDDVPVSTPPVDPTTPTDPAAPPADPTVPPAV